MIGRIVFAVLGVAWLTFMWTLRPWRGVTGTLLWSVDVPPHKHVYHVSGLANRKQNSSKKYFGECECGDGLIFDASTWWLCAREHNPEVIFESLALK